MEIIWVLFYRENTALSQKYMMQFQLVICYSIFSLDRISWFAIDLQNCRVHAKIFFLPVFDAQTVRGRGKPFCKATF